MKQVGAKLTYYEEINNKAFDEILGITMFEATRREANMRAIARGDKMGLKVVLGAFIRTDIPNGDFTCAGALGSLQFVQGMMIMMDAEAGKKRAQHLELMQQG